MRNLLQATLYPGIGAIEGTNLSVGRGTDTPFEQLGAPWIDGVQLSDALNARRIPGVSFYPVRFTPTSSKYANEECQGVFMIVTDRLALRPVRARRGDRGDAAQAVRREVRARRGRASVRIERRVSRASVRAMIPRRLPHRGRRTRRDGGSCARNTCCIRRPAVSAIRTACATITVTAAPMNTYQVKRDRQRPSPDDRHRDQAGNHAGERLSLGDSR